MLAENGDMPCYKHLRVYLFKFREGKTAAVHYVKKKEFTLTKNIRVEVKAVR